MITFEPVPYHPPTWATTRPGILLPSHRIPLGLLPTPIQRWTPPGLPEGVALYMKRDDLTGMQLSGNKVRKLEFILAEAKAQGHDCVVTLGGIQSNHARATAVAARYVGLDAHLILRTSRAIVDQDPGLVGNLLLNRLMGAHIHLVTKEEYSQHGQIVLGQELVARLRQEGRNPYFIPVGGSSGLGTWGYIEMANEVLQQASEEGLNLTDIVTACGSGGTTAGLAVGTTLSGSGIRVTGYMVCDDEAYFRNHINNEILNKIGFDSEGSGGADILSSCRFVQAKGKGYALSHVEEVQTVSDVAAATGVILDPVYTGKALHTMLEEMNRSPEEWKGRSVLFVHTGGLLGLYEQSKLLLDVLSSNQDRVHRLTLPRVA